jgi:hypothetical protein
MPPKNKGGSNVGTLPPTTKAGLHKPTLRRLRGYSFDPSVSAKLETAFINERIYTLPWEELRPGPVGEYVEVIDVDPASGAYYEPVDLGAEHLLAQDGLPASALNPQFHQQMAYAVVMTTIKNFERAIGRPVMWSDRQRWKGYREMTSQDWSDTYVPCLAVYPHALREANAYYSPKKKALLLGYFPASAVGDLAVYPGGIVFGCLSHDVIAHETAHAILDGIHPRFMEVTQPDGLAFHEAFADLVAMFQHFTFPEVVKHQVAKTRGDMSMSNLLGELAQEFGRASGARGSLRDALGTVNRQTGKWERRLPEPRRMQTDVEPHQRGSILVSAVFDAFIAIYESRIADLRRIASGGTGILNEGELHPDLVNRLAAEAVKSARHVLTICIRALDYCPPVDIDFGDYLRALITADRDVYPNDTRSYRVAFIDAFRQHGIYPRSLRSLSEEGLTWDRADEINAYERLAELDGLFGARAAGDLAAEGEDAGGTAGAFTFLKQKRAPTILETGTTTELPGVSNVRIYIVGPPKDADAMRKTTPYKGEGYALGESPIGLADAFLAAFDPSDERAQPFAAATRHPLAELKTKTPSPETMLGPGTPGYYHRKVQLAKH